MWDDQVSTILRAIYIYSPKDNTFVVQEYVNEGLQDSQPLRLTANMTHMPHLQTF